MALLQIEANPLILHASTTENEVERMSKNIGIRWVLKDDIDLNSINSREKWLEIGKVNLCIYPNDTEGNTIPEKGVILHQTSGTYGRPLQCIRNQKVAVAEAVNYVSSIKQFDKITIRVTTPLNHAFAYGFGLISSIITDSNMIIDTSFNPKKVLNEETKNVSDILCVVPPMLESLIYFKQADDSFQLPHSVYYAGTMCAPSLKDKFETTFGSELFAILGSTETGAIACSNSNNGKANGVGKILNNVNVSIKNTGKYKDLGENIGELYVKSTSMMQRYCDERFPKEIDCFSTGDLAKFDENNDLHIIGRIKDIINVGGAKVDPVEVEKVLLEYQGIDDAIVYSGCSENRNEIVLAAISSNEDLDESSILDFCAKRLNHYKIPRRINILKDIPRTPSGKCLKPKLPGYNENKIF
jgi:long-chain acyl-CoA synthetase